MLMKNKVFCSVHKQIKAKKNRKANFFLSPNSSSSLGLPLLSNLTSAFKQVLNKVELKQTLSRLF